MNHHLLPPHHDEATMLSTPETAFRETINSSAAASLSRSRKQRVTITLPQSLLERLRNAVYWTGHGPLARLIAEALDDAVTQMEQANGQAFPRRLAPLKRGRPRTKSRPAALPLPAAVVQ
jgi:predicted DNA binding CopG/RHH family protein